MQRKVLVIFSLLLLSLLSSGVNSEPLQSEILVIDQGQGHHFSDGMVILSGTSNIPLNNATWTLFNNTDENQNFVVIESGNYLTQVTPIDQDVWSWTLSINASGVSCTCVITLGVNNTYTSIYVYIGDSSHKPVILDAQVPFYITNDQDIEIEIDAILPPTHVGHLFIQASTCKASPDRQRCTSEPFEIATPSQVGNESPILSINQTVNQITEGNWIVFFSISDSALNPSNTFSRAFTLDKTAPEISLVVRDNITEGEMLEVYANAIDSGSSSLSYTWRIGEPGQQVKGYNSQENANQPYVSFIPERSGLWTIDVVVRDESGWQNSSSISFQVNNFEPVPILNIDALRIESGDEIILSKQGPWLLSSTDSYDTRNDQDKLVYYWKFESEDEMKIFNTPEVSSDEDFQSDYYEVHFIIYDDDSASNTLEFSINFEQASPLGSLSPMLKIIIALVLMLLPVSIFFLSRRQIRDESTSVIPKWKPKK